jgi:hypothetical protein
MEEVKRSWRKYRNVNLYRFILKSVKHFKNSQQIDYATDHGNAYADRERNLPSFFQGKARAHKCHDLPLGQSQRTRFLRIPKQNDCSRLLNAIFATTVS